MLNGNARKSLISLAAGASFTVLIHSAAAANDNANIITEQNGTPLTAGVVMEKMSTDMRYGYITGIIEGLAFARHLDGDSDGMVCLYGWLYESDTSWRHIIQTFHRFSDRLPANIISALARRECGGE